MLCVAVAVAALDLDLLAACPIQSHRVAVYFVDTVWKKIASSRPLPVDPHARH